MPPNIASAKFFLLNDMLANSFDGEYNKLTVYYLKTRPS